MPVLCTINVQKTSRTRERKNKIVKEKNESRREKHKIKKPSKYNLQTKHVPDWQYQLEESDKGHILKNINLCSNFLRELNFK